jgi:hypothetical protein
MPAEFRDLVLRHRGARIAIMGGGPTLAEQVPQIDADVWISTNAHGLNLRSADYIVAMDETHSRFGHCPMRKWLRDRSALPIIGPEYWADYVISGWPSCPTRVLTGPIAAWCAFGLGASVIILAGMDNYAGEGTQANKSCDRVAPFIHCPVRVFGGGPLTHWWPAFDPAEEFQPYEPHPAVEGIRGMDNAVRVRVNKPTQIRGVERYRGDELTVNRHEVAFQLKHKLVFEL